MKTPVISFIITIVLSGSNAFAQGEDSQPEDRDLQVIATMLPGGYDNANQNYFDSRGKRDTQHRRIHMEIAATDTDNEFIASSFWDNDPEQTVGDYWLTLAANHDVGAVEMRVVPANAGDSDESCSLFWHREAAQFRASASGDCSQSVFREMVLSQTELWVDMNEVEDADFRMHRVRNFECYADIPGVGGGRDQPYERYEGFKIHDQGDAVWFDTKDGRELGISLFLVDWPINNYKGIFTRDSFVIYVSEKIDGENKEHGYAFTVPEADRIGINLKWMLASCFMKSNKYAIPYM